MALMDDGPPAEPAGLAADAGPLADGREGQAGDLAPMAAALRQARRPVLLLGPHAVPHTAGIRAAVVGRGIPALHTYRARGIVPDSAAEAAGLLTGGTMEWPLLAQADLIIGLGVDEAEMIPAAWDYAAPTVLVGDWPAGHTGATGYFTGATTLTAPLPAAIDLLARWTPPAGSGGWAPAAGRAARADATRRLAGAATATSAGSVPAGSTPPAPHRPPSHPPPAPHPQPARSPRSRSPPRSAHTPRRPRSPPWTRARTCWP